MSELILVRHGQASFGADSYDKLSDTGVRQVQILSEHWQTLGQSFDAVYAGTLLRQRETAQWLLPVIAEAEIRTHAGLNEYNGEPLLRIYLRDHARQEGYEFPHGQITADKKTFQKVLEAASRHWLAGTLITSDTDSDFEPWLNFRARVHTALNEIMAKHGSGSRIVLATSGGVIATALQLALNLPDNQTIATNWMVNNSSVTRLVYGRGKISLGSFNSLSHLENPQHHALITFR